MVTAGAGTSRVLELRGPMMVKGRYDDATMKVALWQKDMAVIGEFAQSLGCPTPLFNATGPLTTPPWRAATPCTTPPPSAPCSNAWPVSVGASSASPFCRGDAAPALLTPCALGR